jgi:hypothetical protein
MWLVSGLVFSLQVWSQELQPVVPATLRGNANFERSGLHDANLIRTLFYSYGMVGDFKTSDVLDITVDHFVEVPKGSGENYSDGITPFVLAKITQRNGRETYIMETGFRERQGTSPFFNRVMRFEPRPGYFQADPAINQGRSVAMSNDPRTWPDEWINRLEDSDDPGWSGSWNGYFGKAIVADQESYTVYDDQYYDAWDFFPDSRDSTRKGLGLRVEQRGLQWSNPQAGNVIFWVYDITNEGTTDYNDNIIFGLYMDSGVGGSAVGVDGIPESDDDNAYYDKSLGLNLVYTWDKNGNGFIGETGYLGYAYLETPGNPFDGSDNDSNGVVDEKRDGGPGQLIEGRAAIEAYLLANYNMSNFEAFFGPLQDRPAYRTGIWWTGDEDMDWVAEFHDTGADGIFADDDNPSDSGENDGMPTLGEPNFDRTDVDESDQIGLTGFKMNRIRAGAGSPSTETDQIVFFQNEREWPRRLYEQFTSDTPFDEPLVLNYNIGFLFASGPFRLQAGKTERFSLALAFGRNLRELRNTVLVVQNIYKANYRFAVPPPLPTLQAYAGDGYVTLSWDDRAERAFDEVLLKNDFEGYRIYRSTDAAFRDPQIITTGTGTSTIGNGVPIAQFDLINDVAGFSSTAVEGVGYFLGEDTGITHTFTDSTVTNGQLYYYAVTSYDTGSDSIEIYPSENAITVSRTLRGGTILPQNIITARPNPPTIGYTLARASEVEQTRGRGVGSVRLQVLNSDLVPDGHDFRIDFTHEPNEVKASAYRLIDVTEGDTLFEYGADFAGLGTGPVAAGLLPIVETPATVSVDSANTGFSQNSATNAVLSVRYAEALPINVRRPGFPEDIEIVFDDIPLDTSIAAVGLPAVPANFRVLAKTQTGDFRLRFRFRDTDGTGTFSAPNDYIEIVTFTPESPNAARATWRVQLDTTGQDLRGPLRAPAAGDVFTLSLNLPYSTDDVFSFTTTGHRIDQVKAQLDSEPEPYVVPNPYVGAASFEPERFAVSGRGERRIEFRGLPERCTIRIFTIAGELVQTLEHDAPINQGFIGWDLRSRDNLEVAPGLYIFHVESELVKPHVGKFAIIK